MKWWEGTPNPQPSGVELHFSGKSIDVDGMWCEGAMGYQFMALQALVVDAEMLWHHGIDLYRYRDCALKCVFDSPLYFCYPNLLSPAIHDSGNASIVGYNSDLYEYGYLRYRDPKYLEVLRRIKRRLMASFQLFTISTLYDVDLSAAGDVVAPESVNLNGVGYGVLRVTDGEGTRNLLLDYGPNRSHGHPDKLNIDLWGEATRHYNPTKWTNKKDENVLPYLVDTYPNIVFFEADVQERVTELRTDINAYVNENYVAFISGEKEMTDENLAEFFNTIRDLGYDELLGYYIDYYDAYLAAAAE